MWRQLRTPRPRIKKTWDATIIHTGGTDNTLTMNRLKSHVCKDRLHFFVLSSPALATIKRSAERPDTHPCHQPVILVAILFENCQFSGARTTAVRHFYINDSRKYNVLFFYCSFFGRIIAHKSGNVSIFTVKHKFSSQ